MIPDMLKTREETSEDLNPQETAEWLESLDEIIDEAGPERAAYVLQALNDRAAQFGVTAPLRLNTRYVNTIPREEEVPYPGDREIERRIKSLIRWNALAMVVRANKYDDNIGGHISTYASVATLIEVGQNHFFHGSYGDQPGDFIYFQGHASPGMYARAFLEGRLTEENLKNFRHELRDVPGLSSYPHPWLMPDFWQFPTVSMGLGPINAIYQARFMRYLENRGIIPVTPRKIWAFIGDGESDEPESLGALTLGSREKLDNLIFVVNCNLQRLDGPVRGNGRIVDELEGAFRGAGWNVIKVLWGSDWDDLLARDRSGLLLRRMEECVDGEYQNFKAKGGAYVRREFFGKYPELLELVKDMSDEELAALRRGGHDPVKVYNAFKRAVEHKGRPTVILAKTVKGYGLGEAGEGRNATHQQKKLNDTQVSYFARRFEMAIPEEKVKKLEFYRPPEDSPEMKYLQTAARGAGRLGAGSQADAHRAEGSAARYVPRHARRLGGARGFDHLRLRGCAEGPAAIRPQEVHRADHSGRSPHLRHGFPVHADRHLREPGPEVHTGRSRHGDVLQGSQGRPDPRRRHHRGRRHGLVHRRRHRVRELPRADDSFLRLLLDVRVSARGRSRLGLRRFARQGLPDRRHGRAHDPVRRRTAAHRRAQPAAVQRRPDLPRLRPGVTPTKSRSSCRMASAACTRRTRTVSTT